MSIISYNEVEFPIPFYNLEKVQKIVKNKVFAISALQFE